MLIRFGHGAYAPPHESGFKQCEAATLRRNERLNGRNGWQRRTNERSGRRSSRPGHDGKGQCERLGSRLQGDVAHVLRAQVCAHV